jgi:uncharacterized protein
MSENKIVWSKGVRFECQGSGKCCVSRGEYGYVYLSLKDRKRLASFLKLPTREFTRKFCKSEDGSIFLKNPEKPCRFLVDKKCSVYEARPTQCRTWPFWPENMKPRNWAREVESFCPGVGKGKMYSEKEIQDILRQNEV